MNVKKWMSLLAVVVIASLALSACAQPTPSAPTPVPPTAPAAVEATKAPEPTPVPPPTTAPEPTAPPPTTPPEPTKPAEPAVGGTMTGAFDQGPGGFPERFDAWNATAGYYWYDMYLGKLVTYADTTLTKMTGDLAESWDISPDGKVYTFKLRSGVTWHDGQPFTADDVKFTLDTVATPGVSTFSGNLSTVTGYKDLQDGKTTALAGVEVVDPQTVKITNDSPNAAFLAGLSFIYIMPQHAMKDIPVKEIANNPWWGANPVGTGPFKWSKYEKGQYVELLRFDNYWRGAPKLDKLINRYFPEAGTAVLALEAGEIDFTYVTADEMERLKENPKIEIIPGPSWVPVSLYFNERIPAFQDKRVRQAFLYAIDRESIRDNIWKGAAQIVNCCYRLESLVPADVNPYPYDPAKAKALLDEAKFDYTQEFEIITYYGDQLTKDVLAAVQQNLADTGVKVTPRFVDVPTFVAEYYNENPKWTIGYAGSGNGPDPDIQRQTWSSEAKWPTGNNITDYANPDVDKAFNAGRAEADPAKRDTYYQQVCKMLNEDAPAAWLTEGIRYGASTGRIANFVYTPSPGGGRYYNAAETWYVK